MIHAFLWMFLLIQAQTAEPQPPAEAVTLLQSGLDAERAGDLDQAIAAFRKAANLDPSSPVVFLNLGDAYMKKHDYAAAVPPLKHALELSPDSPPVNQLLGFALLAEGYASEAIPRLEIVHEYGALGIAELQAGHPEEAVTNLESALAKDPNNPDLLYYLSRAATALSSQSLDRLLSEFPDTARGHQALGQNYFEMKMFPQAVKEFEQAIAMRPDLPGLRLELGQVYEANSDWEKAEEQFRGETKLQPGSAAAAYQLGDALLQEGKMREAAVELQRSNSLRPQMSETLYDLGKATAISDPHVAEHALGRVIELEKETPLAGRAYLLLAEIHRRQGKTEQASREIQEFRRIQSLTAHPQP